MDKKEYIKPEMQVIEIAATSILSASIRIYDKDNEDYFADEDAC